MSWASRSWSNRPDPVCRRAFSLKRVGLGRAHCVRGLGAPDGRRNLLHTLRNAAALGNRRLRPYAVSVTAVLFGKHKDKIDYDTPLGVKTVPVLLGEETTKKALESLVIFAYASVVGLVMAGYLPYGR